MLRAGRPPKVSQSYKPGHAGVDIMFRREPEDGGPPGQTKLPFFSPGHYMPHNIPVVAWRDGVVTKASRIGTGNRIRIDHGGGLWSAYYHLGRMTVGIGDTVKAGEQVGTVGHGPEYPLNHLHFEIWQNERQVDPRPYLSNTQILSSPKGGYGWLLGGALAVAAGLYVSRFIR